MQPGDEVPKELTPEPEKTVDESMEDIIQSQKRNLDEFCFAEHFEPDVLKQVKLCVVACYFFLIHDLLMCLSE